MSASEERVFALVDDPERLTAHMSQPSWRMGGGSMKTVLDEGRGREPGSHIRVGGRVFGRVREGTTCCDSCDRCEVCGESHLARDEGRGYRALVVASERTCCGARREVPELGLVGNDEAIRIRCLAL